MTCTLNYIYVHDVIIRIIHVYYLCCYSGLALCCEKNLFWSPSWNSVLQIIIITIYKYTNIFNIYKYIKYYDNVLAHHFLMHFQMISVIHVLESGAPLTK